ncbi:SCO family protein [Aureimonas pseudogalii]|uniref:Protein SCO1/2 n=1 Tax=Aureimonas pseudogalii TaxID=1744844 RepID=A0A7W6MKZ6_9HYPH|nr:SCO family protein [Aureimonas pseudogalii]MBB3999315.1 protein SCO1/2 [Aureimonas pseudogalii]
MTDPTSRPPRRKAHALRWALWVLVAAIVALLVLVVVFGRQETSAVRDAGVYGSSFQLVDQNGGPVSESVLRGRPTALFFGFTHCPDVCPTTLYELAGYQKALKAEGRDLAIVFVSVDPERDTPDVLRTYVGSIGADVTAVTGDPAKVAAMLDGFGIYAKKVPQGEDYTMDHTASVILLDRAGAFKGTIAYGEDPEAAKLKLARLAAA